MRIGRSIDLAIPGADGRSPRNHKRADPAEEEAKDHEYSRPGKRALHRRSRDRHPSQDWRILDLVDSCLLVLLIEGQIHLLTSVHFALKTGSNQSQPRRG